MTTSTLHLFKHPFIHPLLEKRLQSTFLPRFKENWSGNSPFIRGALGPQSIRLDGNDYLSLTGHSEIVNAQINHLRGHHSEVVQSCVFHHVDHPCRNFERHMASWLGKTDGILCQSGYAANMGLLQSIADESTPVYIDMLAHASLWEGVRSAKAPAHAFRHNDPAHLRRQIEKNGPGIVVVDSIYSTTGAICPLEQMVQVSEELGCVIVVDESHSLGTHGPQGAGLCKALGLTDRVHFITASLAKAFAGRAGYFTIPAVSDWERHYFLSESFPSIFSSSLLDHEVAALAATLQVIIKSDLARERLCSHTQRLRHTLENLGYPIHQGTEQIIALEVGTEAQTCQVQRELHLKDIFGAVFCAPATTSNRTMVRLTLNAGLTEVELEQLGHRFESLLPIIRPETWSASKRRPSPHTQIAPGSMQLVHTSACPA